MTYHVYYDDLTSLIHLSVLTTVCPTFGGGRTGRRILILPLVVFFFFHRIYCKCVRAYWAYLVVLVSSVFCLLITLATLDPLRLSSSPRFHSFSFSLWHYHLFFFFPPECGTIIVTLRGGKFRQKDPLCDGCYRCCVCIRSVKLKRTWTDTEIEMDFWKIFLAPFSFVYHSHFWFRFVCSNQLWRGRRKISSLAENSHSLRAGRINPRKAQTKSVSVKKKQTKQTLHVPHFKFHVIKISFHFLSLVAASAMTPSESDSTSLSK